MGAPNPDVRTADPMIIDGATSDAPNLVATRVSGVPAPVPRSPLNDDAEIQLVDRRFPDRVGAAVRVGPAACSRERYCGPTRTLGISKPALAQHRAVPGRAVRRGCGLVRRTAHVLLRCGERRRVEDDECRSELGEHHGLPRKGERSGDLVHRRHRRGAQRSERALGGHR